MDGNKDDALKCLRISKEAIKGGDRARALKFVTKAQRLDPTLPVDDLLSEIEKDSEGKSAPKVEVSSNGPSRSPSFNPLDKPSLRQRVSSTGSSSSSTYTEEQVAIVRQIKKKKDYYEILAVEKSCSVEDIRKAYRKISLKVHPDKNQAPGAEEAFKLVSKAFQCLSNEESRTKYDLVGSDEPVYERRTTRHATHGFNGFYDADIDAEEIFRNFFFGGMAPATQFRGFSYGNGMGPRPAEQQGNGGANIRALLQLLPVLFILLLSFLPSSEPIYSFSRSHPYEYKITSPKGVNYYVKSTKFEQDYPLGSQERTGLEQRVEREYFNILAQNCRAELQRKQWGFIRETPHCNLLQKFDQVAY